MIAPEGRERPAGAVGRVARRGFLDTVINPKWQFRESKSRLIERYLPENSIVFPRLLESTTADSWAKLCQ